ncbi:MAG TPA: UDP-glucose 4-epimerase GalE [Candidatus Limnocylindrales bacterium]|nr:UDP-glucose 4-epimerase GalE [Candidatus Limnocylindrales bacterium]
MSRKVLVTGGAGYVGAVSVEALVAAGHEVVVLDDLSTGHRAAIPDGVPVHVGSYGERDRVADLLRSERIDSILHCAARSLVPESIANPARYYTENVAGGIALLEACRLAGIRRVVFSSTAAVYGNPETTPIDEDHPLRPINPYGETKRAFEAALRWYGAAYGIRSVTLRYFNVAGATDRIGEVHEPETHLIPNILRAAEGQGEVTVFGTDYPTPDGTCIRDYIHVADLADAHLLALEATAPGDPRTGADPDAGEQLVLNLGTARGFSVLEVLRTAETVVGRPIPHRLGPRRAGDPPILVASNARARDVLGWSPRRSALEPMIRSAWEWRRRHPAGYREPAPAS